MGGEDRFKHQTIAAHVTRMLLLAAVPGLPYSRPCPLFSPEIRLGRQAPTCQMSGAPTAGGETSSNSPPYPGSS